MLTKRWWHGCGITSNGSLSRVEFKDRLEEMGFHLHPDEFSKLMTVFDADNSGEISFAEWNNLVGRIVQPGEGGTNFFPRTAPNGKPAVARPPVKEWAEAAFIQALVRDCGSELQAFQRIDTDNDGTCIWLWSLVS